MFVIVQCWSNIQKDPLNAGLSLPDRIGIALKHAGVSVTVTSLTDVFAFSVGAVTVSCKFQKYTVREYMNCTFEPNHYPIKILLSANAGTGIFLCLHCHRPGLHLSIANILVCCLDVP